MAVTVEQVQVLVTAEVDKALKDLRRVQDAPKGVENSFVNLARTIAGPAVGILILNKIKDMAKATIKLASDAEETRNKFSVVFKDVASDAADAAESLSENFGLSGTAAQQLLSDTGDLLTGFGFTGESALDLSTKVNELAVNLASFTNFSGGAQGASEALTKALLGERESVKALGISILETDVQAKVLENTQNGLTFASNRQAKAYATLQLAQEQSKNAIGDFERSSASLANQQRIAQAAVEDLTVEIGEKLLPVAATIVGSFGRVTGALADFIDEQQRLKEAEKAIEEGNASLDQRIILLKKENEELQLKIDRINTGQQANEFATESDLQFARDRVAGIQAEIDANNRRIKGIERVAEIQQTVADQQRTAEEQAAETLRLRAEAENFLTDRILSRRTEEEVQLDILNQQIDKWVEIRSQLRGWGKDQEEISEVQALINDLIKERNELQADDIELTDQQIEADQRLLDKLMEEEAIRDRNRRIAQEEAEERRKATEEAEEAQKKYNQELENYRLALEAATVTAQGLAEVGLNSLVTAFSDIGEAIAAGELQFKDFGKLALNVLADILQTVGAQLAAQAALLFFGLIPDPTRGAGALAASAAAFTGSGVARGLAGALAEGGSFTTNGPTPLLVGDNPGGEEKVTVEPVSSNGANVGRGGGDIFYLILDDGTQLRGYVRKGTQDDIDNGRLRRSAGGRI